MTEMENDDPRDDVDWLKDAFDRAVQGDNGTVPESARPAVNPFSGGAPAGGTVPPEPVLPVENTASNTPIVPHDSMEMPAIRHDHDLDFETDDMPPITAFESVLPVDHSIPSVVTDYPPTETLDAVDLPATVAPEPMAANAQSDSPRGIEQIDALFSSTATRPITNLPVSPQPRPPKPIRESKPADDASFRRRLLLIVAGIAVVTISIAMFFAGRFVASSAIAPTPEMTDSPADLTMTQPPGEYPFAQLFGGECVDPFDTAWAVTFTVVECVTPHPAQLVYVGDLALDGSYLSYPGDDRIGNAAMAECSRKGVLNLTSAKKYSDLTLSAAYPISSEAWDSGDKRYYCFVTLSSGAAIEGDLAGKLITQGVEGTPEPIATP